MLYVFILYCTGTCPEWLPPPSDVLLYHSLTECEAQKTKFDDFPQSVIVDGKPRADIHVKATCARLETDISSK
jgi:hypothetical protein